MQLNTYYYINIRTQTMHYCKANSVKITRHLHQLWSPQKWLGLIDSWIFTTPGHHQAGSTPWASLLHRIYRNFSPWHTKNNEETRRRGVSFWFQHLWGRKSRMNREISKYPTGSPKQQKFERLVQFDGSKSLLFKNGWKSPNIHPFKNWLSGFQGHQVAWIEGFQLSEVGTQSGNVAKPRLKTNRSLEQLMVVSDDSFPFEAGPFSRDMCSLGGVTFHAKLHLKSFQGRIPLQSTQFESMSWWNARFISS